MTVYPCAKINLGLNVVNKRLDGYHNLETVFYPIDIHDELSVEVCDTDGCKLVVKGQDTNCDANDNLVVKAYNLLRKDYIMPGVCATLVKSLPMQAGLGGGSSDGAYMIRLLNEMFQLGLGKNEMKAYASRLGADCAFFIEAEPSYAEGIGDILVPCDIPVLKGHKLVLVKPDVAVSTKEAYAGITPCSTQKKCIDILGQPISTWRDELKNDFEDSVFSKLPVLSDIKKSLYDKGALYAAMSGSGSTVYGIFNDNPSEIESVFPDYYVKVVSL